MTDDRYEQIFLDLKDDLHELAEKHGKRLLEKAARDATSSQLLYGIAQDLNREEPTAEPQSEEGSRSDTADQRPPDAYRKEWVDNLLTKITTQLGTDD